MKLEIGQIWKHLERGTIYGIYGFTTLQVEGPDDDAEAVTYRDLCEPAKSWTRPITTFLDGRFVCLDPVTAAEEIGKIVIAEMLKKLDLSGFTGGGSVSKDEFIHGSTEANLILHSEKIVYAFGGKMRNGAAWFQSERTRGAFETLMRRFRERPIPIHIYPPEGTKMNRYQVLYGAMVYLNYGVYEAGKLADCICPGPMTPPHTLTQEEALQQGEAVVHMRKLWGADQ